VLRVWPVDKKVGNVKNDGPELLEPHASSEEMPTLLVIACSGTARVLGFANGRRRLGGDNEGGKPRQTQHLIFLDSAPLRRRTARVSGPLGRRASGFVFCLCQYLQPSLFRLIR
jgi:hypothetical protein